MHADREQGRSSPPRVLIVTGPSLSLFNVSSWVSWAQRAVSDSGWRDGLALFSRLTQAERLTVAKMTRQTLKLRNASYRTAVERFFAPGFEEFPELAQVTLATTLHEHGIPFDATSLSDLLGDPVRRARLLDRCDVVFLSSTLILSLTELKHAVQLLKRPSNRLVVGGALSTALKHQALEIPGIDAVAIGYGEFTVPALCAWMKDGFRTLPAPPTGRVERHGDTWLVMSGVPEGKSLDHLPTPDWGLIMRYHRKVFKTVRYESVRGCPYRCEFCDYPFLFDDTKFRMRSAAQIAQDWRRLVELGVERIDCFDSLFTMPRKRLLELCETLLADRTHVKWTCYARADDLRDMETCRLMRRAGCIVVNIGAESGSQEVLDNMNKRCTTEANAQGIKNAKAAGLVVMANFVVGFPGDSLETARATLAFLRDTRPDYVSVYPMNLGSGLAPVMSPQSRRRFGLVTNYDGWSKHPYWQHDTMSCIEAIDLSRWLQRQIMVERLGLDPLIFCSELMPDTSDHAALLDFQRDLALGQGPVRAAWRVARDLSRARAKKAMDSSLAAVARPARGRLPMAEPHA